MPKQPAPCIEAGCSRKKRKGVHRCVWHWLLTQPIERQVAAAQWRRERAEAREGYVYRARVPKKDWPAGGRWCAGCQQMIPNEYMRGSRCRAHSSQASHASHVERTYEITSEEYRALLEWQGGRCYVCQRTTTKRLAVDHDHRTGAVRGLLCASDDWGCNRTLALPLNDVEAARRLLAYVEMPPIERMRRGEPPVARRSASPTLDSLRRGLPRPVAL